MELRDEFAIRILLGLMQRRQTGYGDSAAIVEAYDLAEHMIAHKKWRAEERIREEKRPIEFEEE